MALAYRNSLVIPAYNEADRIGPVIESALSSSFVDEIFVVDDGSTDHTADVADEYPVSVLRKGANHGKGIALNWGVTYARALGEVASLTFLDADLKNLTPEHVDNLIKPVLSGSSLMTIGTLERTKAQKAVLKRWGALSGQRSLKPAIWDLLYEHDLYRPPEAALNARMRKARLHDRIERVELNGVTHVGQREKKGLVKGTQQYFRTYGSALLTYARIQFEKQDRLKQ